MARNDQDFSGLAWVKGEIEETLKQAQGALKNYIENSGDITQLRFCTTYLHQVRGTLKILELYGAELLAEEMEHVAQALLDDKVNQREDAYGVLLKAIMHMPSYLERISSGHTDIPIVLLPLLNDLRTSRNQSLLSDNALFSPDLSVPAPQHTIATNADTDQQQDEATLRKLRQRFQFSLVGWYRNTSQHQMLQNMADVLDNIESLQENRNTQIWWVARGLFEAIKLGGIELSISIKMLMGQVDREIKQLIDQKEDYDPKNAADLTKNMLFYIGHCDKNSPLVNEIKQTFKLEHLLPSEHELENARDRLNGPDSQLLNTVSLALQEELLHIKDTLDLFVRNPDSASLDVEKMRQNLQQVADTLGLLGQGVLRSRIIEQTDYLDTLFDEQGQLNDSSLMKVASALLSIESSLSSLTEQGDSDERTQDDFDGVDQDAEYYQLMQDVIREALQDIAQIKGLVVRFAEHKEHDELLSEVPRLLTQVKGGLKISGVHKPISLLEEINQFLGGRLVDEHSQLNNRDVDLLADTITGIEYYLESLIEQRSDRPEILGFARHSLDSLKRETAPNEQLPTEELSTQTSPYIKDDGLDDMQDVFIEEAEEEQQRIVEQLELWKANSQNQEALTTIRRSFHTLKGSGRLIGADEIAEFAWSIENMLNKATAGTFKFSDELLNILQLSSNILPSLIASLRDQQPHQLDVESLIQRADTLAGDKPSSSRKSASNTATTDDSQSTTNQIVEDKDNAEDLPAEHIPPDVEQTDTAGDSRPLADDVDDEIIEIFIEEAQEQLEIITTQLPLWENNFQNHEALSLIRRAFHTLKGSGRMVAAGVIGEYCWAIEKMLNRLLDGEINIREEHATLLNHATELLPTLISAYQTGNEHDGIELASEIARVDQLSNDSQGVTVELDTPLQTEPTPETSTVDAVDEVTEVFLEEAVELLAHIDHTLHENIHNTEHGNWIGELQRDLHTLKGSARMAGIEEVGDLSHELESLLELLNEQQQSLPKPLIDFLLQCHDQLLSMVEDVQQQRIPASGALAIAQIAEWLDDPQKLTQVASIIPLQNNAPIKEEGILKQPTNESLRLRAEQMDSLVNDSAELGVFKSRISQQLNASRYNLSELQQTISRIQQQLRTLEIETEAHMQHRSAELNTHSYSEFDSLEFDRFSKMHQLSRSLIEGLSDLENLQKLLQNQARDTDMLFEQQHRRHDELHNKLMSTRLVPFSSVTPRLRRIIRQTAESLGKNVTLKVINEHLELDRSVLNHVQPTFEHLLRNAIDHGIETAEQRQKIGKPEEGCITITLSQKANQIGVELSDDGAGLDREKILNKALQLNMLDEEDTQQLSNIDIYQYILAPGFSTANQVTQISGRGVGMDVVNTGVKQLGGTLQLRSTPQQGTTFSINLPLTLATQHVLMAKVADCTYGLPLNGFLGLARMPSDEYLQQIASEQPTLHHNEQEYRLLSLEEVMGHSRATTLRGKQAYLQLFHLNDHYLALHADTLLGHHEIVMKPLGTQVSALPSIAGGTIMADGSVVLIIDLAAVLRLHLARHGHVQQLQQVVEKNKNKERKLTVMIVDDSLTVRKMSSRFIERNNMLASTANDGFDAIEKLQKSLPDIILLDVEMPRMDGFEFATYVRGEEKYNNIPIIMITSRTGQKHRERAMNIGIDLYLGKPYNEQELLKSIFQLTGNQVAIRHE